MKLVVLGSGTSVPHSDRASAAFWLEMSAGSLLLDCSADAPHRMAEEALDWPNLDAIWISHLHLDHCGGLAPLLFGMKHAAQTRSRKKPLQIVGCTGTKKLLAAIDNANDYKLFELPFPLDLIEISADDSSSKFEIMSGVTAAVVSTPHRPESLALRIADEHGTTVVYSSDTGFSEEVAQFARQADLFVLCLLYTSPSPRD